MSTASETGLAPAPQSNFPASIRERLAQGRIPWAGPVALVCLRTTMWMATQGLLALVLLLRHHATPWRDATFYFTMCGTVGDLTCLAAMKFLTRREGIRLRDLLGPIRMRYGRDLWLGLGILLLMAVSFIGGGMLSQRIFYGASNTNPGIYLWASHALPLWAVVYNAAVWWVIQSFTEELTYQGYCLPRLEALTERAWGQPWIGPAVVAFWFTAQHCCFGFVPDVRFLIYRFCAFLPGVVLTVVLYRRIRRLAPLILAHWPMDILVVVMLSS
jgi:hypothetical protein